STPVRSTWGFHHRPGRGWSRRPVKHLLNGIPVLRHFFPISPVFVRQLPLFMSEALAFLKSPELFIGIDMKPELQNDCSKVNQVLFHPVDFTICTPPLRFGTKSFYPLDQNTPVPAPIKNSDMPRLWHLRPEAPKIVMRFFHVIRGS